MKRSVAGTLFCLGAISASASSLSVEERLTILEKEVEQLKLENKMLRASATKFLSKELEESERRRARAVYREQVIPMVLSLTKDLGVKLPKLPKEEEIDTMVDAYRPWAELIASLGAVADIK